ncbi:hypothetical protein [Chitinivorax sp. B]|uniref:hypothetical protein n=1 Tax=Chitinivorax sp. B TaxID=2502235 RepID=UPI0010F54DF3|nr:hypothetical protein [Chitinivorax sp. B]
MRKLIISLYGLLSAAYSWSANEITLPEGSRPAGLAAGKDGGMYVSSASLGAIYRVMPGSAKGDVFMTASSLGASATLGLGVDERAQLLWACTITGDLVKPTGSALKAIDLPDGRVKASYDLPTGSVCNDLTIGRDGTVYLTDSAQSMLLRLRKGEDRVGVWLKDDRFRVDGAGVATITDGRGTNGITVDGMGAIMVLVSAPGRLFRVPVRWDGSAGMPLEVKLNRPLVQADGLRLWSKRRLLVVEADGGLARIDWVGETGRVQTLAESVGRPSAVVVRNGKAYVTHAKSASVVTDTSVGERPQGNAGVTMFDLPKN